MRKSILARVWSAAFTSLVLTTSGVGGARQVIAEPIPGWDDSAGRVGVQQFMEYQGEQVERAKRAVQEIDPNSVKHHDYHDGTTLIQALKNILDDRQIVLNPETYDECLQYEQIGLCLGPSMSPAGPTVKLTPYVRYWGPWQRAEQVPEMFRTGYIPKQAVKLVKDAMLTDYYTDFIPNVAQKQLEWGMAGTYDYLTKTLGMQITPGAIPTISLDHVEAAKKAIEARGRNNMGEAAPYQDGYSFNEYHLMMLEPSLYFTMKQPDAAPFYGWCHTQKFPLLWYSEAPGANIFSRYYAMSMIDFATEMALMRDRPFNCIGFNSVPGQGVTPPLFAGLSPTAFGLPCQKYNMGPWVPVSNKVQTQYATTAAAVGFRRSKIAFKRMPLFFYNISPEVDKVQWLHNSRMDDGQSSPKKKKCSKLDKFVLEYQRGNLKINDATDKDHWNVIAHWRKVRCCSQGGIPVYLAPQFRSEESYFPEPEGVLD